MKQNFRHRATRAAAQCMALAVLTGASPLTSSLSGLAIASRDCRSPWAFFDLGQTLVNTSDWDHVTYLPGALDYLRGLRAQGFRLGLLTNVPETWGATQTEKFQTLRRTIAERWDEPEEFVWSWFERVILPRNDQERKPHPAMFRVARHVAGVCRLVYTSEEASETGTADRLGIPSYQVGLPGRSFFPSMEWIQRQLRP